MSKKPKNELGCNINQNFRFGLDPDQIQECVSRYRDNGDKDAFNNLYQLIRQRVVIYIRAEHADVGDEADDIVQEMALALSSYLKREKVAPKGLFPLVYKITRAKIVDHIRKKATNRSLMENLWWNNDPVCGSAPSTKSDVLTLVQILNRAELKGAEKEILILRHACGYTLKEIGTIKNVPLTTAASRLTRARKLLLDYFSGLHNRLYKKNLVHVE